jgi:hypothetical protein
MSFFLDVTWSLFTSLAFRPTESKLSFIWAGRIRLIRLRPPNPKVNGNLLFAGI